MHLPTEEELIQIQSGELNSSMIEELNTQGIHEMPYNEIWTFKTIVGLIKTINELQARVDVLEGNQTP